MPACLDVVCHTVVLSLAANERHVVHQVVQAGCADRLAVAVFQLAALLAPGQLTVSDWEVSCCCTRCMRGASASVSECYQQLMPAGYCIRIARL